MNINPNRILTHIDAPQGDGPVVYWMNRDIRVRDNWALLYAQELAFVKKVPLFVVYNLVVPYLGGGERQWDFKVRALQELQGSCQKKNISFFLLIDENTKDTPELLKTFCKKYHVGVLVTDFSPLRISRAWIEKIKKNITIPFFEVDAHNIVPCVIASDKQEFGAYTLRPKLHKLLNTFLEPFPALKKHPFLYKGKIPTISWKKIHAHTGIDTRVAPIGWIMPGEKCAHTAVAHFIRKILPEYGVLRNDPNAHMQSNLSPYLHYGMIAPARIVFDVCAHTDTSVTSLIATQKNRAKLETKQTYTLTDNAGAFLEELIVRRELSDNFCFYNEAYDSCEGFPDWAKKSHKKHAKDVREYTYTKKQFEEARTHDELWNACQQEMIQTGKMHGYMRMYWAKKILEWTKSPDDAMTIAIYLNDRYELDGRDPNGYAGIAWSIGGVHDRAWFERPVFGQIRYMNANGCASKFDTKKYITTWNPHNKRLFI